MTTLSGMLLDRALATPDRLAFRFAGRGGAPDHDLSYGELHRAALALASAWRERHPAARRVILVTAPGRDFVVALFACFLADLVAVPTYPPTRGDSVARLRAIQRDCRPDFLVTTEDLAAVVASALGSEVVPVEKATDAAAPARWAESVATSSDLALLQYTSGSTGTPKGVMLTHGNLLANLSCIAHSFGHTTESRGVIWLPPYHDMGLIGGILQPVYGGFPVTLMSPQQFLQDPAAWLRRISDERATTSGGPNLAFDLCVQKTSAEERAQLDLSSWTVCFSGSEPVRAQTLQRFADAFAASGFSPRSFFPCYGLAEATLMVSGSGRLAGARVQSFDQAALNAGRLVPLAAVGDIGRPLVSAGSAGPNVVVRIVDPETRAAVVDGAIGEVWVHSPAVGAGYWGQADATTDTFAVRRTDHDDHSYLRTGDLGALLNGELYLTGRRKELVIIGGRKFHPQDLEDSLTRGLECLAGRKSVAFSTDEDRSLVVVQELAPEMRERASAIACQMRDRLAAEFGVALTAVVFVRRSAITTTLTGKTQRLETAERFRAGTLPALASWRADSNAALPGPAVAERESPQIALERALGRSLAADEADRTLVELGFDSLRLAELAAELLRDGGWTIPRDLECCTVRELLASAPSAVKASAISTAPTEQPLSDRQRPIWFSEVTSAGDSYILARIFDIRGPLSGEDVQRACRVLSERHPMLRTRIADVAGAPCHRIVADTTADFARYAHGGNATEWLRRLREEARRPFDLRHDAPWRVRLVELAPRRHLLLVAVHHLVCDYSSLEKLHEEFWALCGGADALPPSPRSFLEYLRREHAAATAWAPSLEFWRSKLQAGRPAADFPRRPGAVPRARGLFKQHAARLRPATFEAFETFCRQQGCTPYVGLVATLQILLARYSRRQDVTIGTTMSVRPAEFTGTIGYFVNPVPLPLRIDHTATFLEVLQQTVELTRAVRAHVHVPFARIVEHVNPDRTRDEAGFFAVLFNYLSATQETSRGGLLGPGPTRLGALTVASETVLPASPQFPLVVQVQRTTRSARILLDYDADQYEESTMRGVAANWEHLLAACAASPRAAVVDLPVLSRGEIGRLRHFQRPPTSHGLRPDIYSAFEAARRAHPGKLAVCGNDATFTYAEFGERVDRIAGALRQRGIRDGAMVAITLERSAEFVVAMWAVLKAGGAVLPIDVALPRERIAYMLQQLPIQLQIGGLDGHRASEHDVVALAELAGASAAPLQSWCHRKQDPAYVIFTSGSTGRPKAVANSHASLDNVLGATDLGMGAEDVFAQYTSVSFDISIWELVLPLVLGGTMAVVPAVDSLDPARLLRAVQRFHVTAMQFVPTILRLFVEEVASSGASCGLRRVVCGGEKLDLRLKDRFFAVLGESTRLWHLYGPAEAAIFVTQREIRPADTTISIGRPIPNARLFILDEQLRPLPVGAVGEICIGGIVIANGYLDNDTLTAERFRRAARPIGRIYRTGDLGRWLPSGEIEYAGRIDHQVKIRGIRIELEEIERALLELPAVRAAAVRLHADESGEPTLQAYLDLHTAAAPAELRRLLRQRLVDAMIPRTFFAVDAMPMTPGGKIDRQRLRETNARELRDTAAAELPDDPVVRNVHAIFADVLGQPAVDIHAHFFALGGHSLQLVQLVQRLRERLGVALPLADVLGHPTIADLATLIRERSNGAELPVESDEVAGVL